MNTTADRINKLRRKTSDSTTKKKTTRKKKASSPEVDISRLDEMSHSELVSLARLMGEEKASRSLSREHLTEICLGVASAEDGPFEAYRQAIHRHVEGNRTLMMLSQIKCDLDCLNCPMDIVADCYLINNDQTEYVDE